MLSKAQNNIREKHDQLRKTVYMFFLHSSDYCNLFCNASPEVTIDFLLHPCLRLCVSLAQCKRGRKQMMRKAILFLNTAGNHRCLENEPLQARGGKNTNLFAADCSFGACDQSTGLGEHRQCTAH